MDESVMIELLKLVGDYNKGIEAFNVLLSKYPDVVRTKLGVDSNLNYFKQHRDVREILGNEIELALGEKKESKS